MARKIKGKQIEMHGKKYCVSAHPDAVDPQSTYVLIDDVNGRHVACHVVRDSLMRAVKHVIAETTARLAPRPDL